MKKVAIVNTDLYTLQATHVVPVNNGNGFKELAGTWYHPLTEEQFEFRYYRDARRSVYDGTFHNATGLPLYEYDVTIQQMGRTLTGHGMNVYGKFTLFGEYQVGENCWHIDKEYTPFTAEDIQEGTRAIWEYVDAHHQPTDQDLIRPPLTIGEVRFALNVAFKGQLFLFELSLLLRSSRPLPPFRILVDAIRVSPYGSKKPIQQQMDFFQSLLYTIQTNGMNYGGHCLHELFTTYQQAVKNREELVKLKRQTANLQTKISKYQMPGQPLPVPTVGAAGAGGGVVRQKRQYIRRKPYVAPPLGSRPKRKYTRRAKPTTGTTTGVATADDWQRS